MEEVIFEECEIRTIIKFLHLGGKSNNDIWLEVSTVCGEGVVSFRTVQRWTAQFKRGDFSVSDKPRSGRPRNEADLQAISQMIDDSPGISAREIGRQLSMNKDTVIGILKNQLDMVKVCTKWIPYSLTSAQKKRRVACAYNMLRILSEPCQHSLVYTQDESWISWQNPRKMMWVKSGVRPPSLTRTSTYTKKQMVSVIFNAERIASIVFLPEGESFTKTFFKEVVIDDFTKTTKIPKTRDKMRQIKFHCDNSTTHQINEHFHDLNIPRMDHPPYSPDLAPCDFFLFGYVQTLLEGTFFSSSEELIRTTTEILLSIPKSMLQKVYKEWVLRLELCILADGEYFE
jgi:histone-lysine N-methyltransferase SETMAR